MKTEYLCKCVDGRLILPGDLPRQWLQNYVEGAPGLVVEIARLDEYPFTIEGLIVYGLRRVNRTRGRVPNQTGRVNIGNRWRRVITEHMFFDTPDGDSLRVICLRIMGDD